MGEVLELLVQFMYYALGRIIFGKEFRDDYDHGRVSIGKKVFLGLLGIAVSVGILFLIYLGLSKLLPSHTMSYIYQ